MQSLRREQGAHVCTALDLPWFRHVALQTPIARTGNIRPLPQGPHVRDHPLSDRALSPSPQYTKVTYSLTASSARRFGWGRKRGREEVCVERARGYPQMRDHSPACLLERGSLISLPQLPSEDRFLSYCPCGPQPDTPQVSPAGSRAPGVEIPTLMTPSNLYSWEPGASLGFSGPNDVSRLFPRFLIIFF